jgi:hypothetical protein
MRADLVILRTPLADAPGLQDPVQAVLAGGALRYDRYTVPAEPGP